MWLCIVWVFRISNSFGKLTAVAVKTSDRKISNLGLPLPAKLIGELMNTISTHYNHLLTYNHSDGMNHRRERLLESVVAEISKQRDLLLSDYWPCFQSFQCSSMLLAGLEKYLFANGFTPIPKTPFLGFNYSSCVAKLRSFKPPKWYDNLDDYKHKCTPSSEGYAQLKLHENPVPGLEIHSYF